MFTLVLQRLQGDHRQFSFLSFAVNAMFNLYNGYFNFAPRGFPFLGLSVSDAYLDSSLVPEAGCSATARTVCRYRQYGRLCGTH